VRPQCRNNLKQIGLAMHNYHDNYDQLPPLVGWHWDGSRRGTFTDKVYMLPYLDKSAEYNQVNVNLEPYDSMGWHGSANQAALSGRLPVFNCPSNDYDIAGGVANFTYAINLGVFPTRGDGWSEGNHNGIASYIGVGQMDPRIRLGAISDGTSNTAAYSEFIIDGNNAIFRYQVRTWVPRSGSPDVIRQACRVNTGLSGRNPQRGASYGWSFSGNGAGYTHTMAPNDVACHCWDGCSDWVGENLMGPSSRHSGGVHVLMCDGSVRFVNDSVNIQTWRAIGTRNQQEQVGNF